MWINSTISKVERCFKNDACPSSCPITDDCRCAAGWRTGRWLVWQNDWPDGRAFGHDCRRVATPCGALKFEVGFLIDALTALMMCVVTFVSLMVHLYTIGYMRDDSGYTRFFAYLSLFTFAMLMLVMSNNFLQLFFGWEAVGLISYLLIGFWYTKESAIKANMKAFIVNRVGDFGFI